MLETNEVILLNEIRDLLKGILEQNKRNMDYLVLNNNNNSRMHRQVREYELKVMLANGDDVNE